MNTKGKENCIFKWRKALAKAGRPAFALSLCRSLLFTLAIVLPLFVFQSHLTERFQAFINEVYLGIWNGSWVWWVSIAALLAALFSNGLRKLKLYCQLLGPPPFLALAAIGYGLLLGLLGLATNTPEKSLVCTLIFAGFLVLLWPEKRTRNKPEDDLNRKYFAERIIDLLTAKDSAIRRIAVIGPWGQGKTRVLDLIQSKLEGTDYCVVKVNPWLATKPEEAWRILAEGFDAALGFRGTWVSNLIRSPILKLILKSLPHPMTDLSDIAMEAFTAKDGDYQGKIEEIEKLLAKRNLRLILLVDDMERSDPAVIRSLFPVIDRLSNFHICSFVFAIDPERIHKAFGNEDAAQAEANGYIDKVFDVQIDLPSLTENEVARWVNTLVDPNTHPRLHASLDSLGVYLPKNPRMAQRFVTKCRSIESQWLVRYSITEKPFEKLFLLQILELEFPGSSKLLLEHEDDIIAIGGEGIEEFSSKKPIVDRESYDKLIQAIGGKVSVNKRFTTLLRRFLELRDEGWFAPDESNDELEWLINGHRKLLYLTTEECRKVSNNFKSDAGKKSIEATLKSTFSERDFSEKMFCYQQVIEHQIEEFRKELHKLESAQGEVVAITQSSCLATLERLSNHQKWANHAKSEIDMALFKDDFFDILVNLFGLNSARYLLADNAASVSGKLLELLLQVTPEISFEKSKSLSLSSLLHDAHWIIDSDDRGSLERMMAPVASLNTQRIFLSIVDLLKKETFVAEFHQAWSGYSYRSFFCANPSLWLGETRNESVALFQRLIETGKSDDIVRRNCIFLIQNAFFFPYLTSVGDIAKYRYTIKHLIQQWTWYLTGLWEIVISRGLEASDIQGLLAGRSEVIAQLKKNEVPEAERVHKPNPDHITVSEFEKVFPLSSPR